MSDEEEPDKREQVFKSRLDYESLAYARHNQLNSLVKEDMGNLRNSCIASIVFAMFVAVLFFFTIMQ